MGRKIPGRKHRGVKDPEKQAAVRFESIKEKINAPPTNPDVQEISKTLQRVIDLKNKTRNGEFIPKKKEKKEVDDSNTIKINKTKGKINDPRFQQLPNESNREFLYRVNKICQNVTKEAAFEDKYNVKVVRNEAGEVQKVQKRPKDELEELIKKSKKSKLKNKVVKKKKKKDENEPPRLTKSQKWQKKKKEKKLKNKSKNFDEQESKRDLVGFGEIVHAPPKLVIPKKAKKLLPEPGEKKFLLSAIMNKNDKVKNQVTKDKLSSVANKTIDKKGKRKDLPNALRRQLDKQQKEIMGAYKLLKIKRKSSKI